MQQRHIIHHGETPRNKDTLLATVDFRATTTRYSPRWVSVQRRHTTHHGGIPCNKDTLLATRVSVQQRHTTHHDGCPCNKDTSPGTVDFRATKTHYRQKLNILSIIVSFGDFDSKYKSYPFVVSVPLFSHQKVNIVTFSFFLAVYPLPHHYEGCGLFPGVRTAT